MNVPILSFNSGELSPLIDARTDTEKYASGCRHLENFIPRVYGCAERRPGTRYVTSQYTSTNNKVRLIPFVYSGNESYSLEFGNLYIRPFSTITYNGEYVTYEGNEIYDAGPVITTPYLEKDLFDVQFKQVGDTLWLVHPNYPQYKLMRVSNVPTFTFTAIVFDNGPFFIRNDLISPFVQDTALMQMAPMAVISEIPGGSFNEIYGTREIAEIFTPIDDCTITSCYLYMYRSGPSGQGLPGTITVTIQGTVLGYATNYFPNGSVKGSGTTDGNSLPHDPTDPTRNAEWRQITFGSPISLNAGVVYALEVQAISAADSNNEVCWVDDTRSSGYDTKNCLVSSPASDPNWYPTTPAGAAFSAFRLFGTVTIGGSIVYTGQLSCLDSSSNPISFFESGHIGSLFKLTYEKVDTDTVVKGKLSSGTYTRASPYVICDPINIKGSFAFTTHGRWTATCELQRNENGAGWETVKIWVGEKDTNVQVSSVEDSDNVQYRAIVYLRTTGSAGGTIRADITSYVSIKDCIVRITAIDSTSVAEIETISGGIVAGATRRWAEGCWSPLRGFPTSVAFFEDRCIYAGMSEIPVQITPTYSMGQNVPSLPTIWLSTTGDYENFEAGVKDDNSFALTITSTEDIAWIDETENLIVATFVDVWKIASNKLDQPLTPTNFGAKFQFAYGASYIQPVDSGMTLLYTDGQKVRELTYEGNENKFNAPDMIILAEHLTCQNIIIGMSLQEIPDMILWCWLDDGSLIGMVYERDQKVVAWFKVPINGKVLSVCSIPGLIENEIWLSIERTISDISHIYIEKMSERNYGSYLDNAYFVDCGLSYSNSDNVTYDGDILEYEGREVLTGNQFNTISNSSQIDGEVVSVLADGVVYNNLNVLSNSISLPTGVTAMKAQAGLSYASKLQPMRLVYHSREGHSQGMITRVPRLSISFYNTIDARYGVDDNILFDINWSDAEWENSADSITGLFTGEVTVSMDGGFSVMNPVIISTDQPLPCIVRSIMPRLEVTGD